MAKSLVVCKYCSKEFLKENYHVKRSKYHFCTRKCSNKFNGEKLAFKKTNKYIGNKYNKLKIISFAFIKNSNSYVNCLCDCGNKCIKQLSSVKSCGTKSCGKCISDKERFMSKVDIVDDKTWIWKGFKDKNGYGRFGGKRKQQLAHRVAYELFIGEIPEGMCCCHKDDNPSNVNPFNLFLGTHKENMLDMARKGRSFKKLTIEKVIKIKKMYKTGKYTHSKLSCLFKVSKTEIWRIINGTRWNNL